MKELKLCLTESIDQDLIKQLKQLLEDPNLTNDIARQMLNVGRFSKHLGMKTGVEEYETSRTFKSGKRKGQTIVIKHVRDLYDDDQYGFRKWMNKVNINPAKIDEISHILIKTDSIEKFIKYIEHPTYSSRDLINGSNILNDISAKSGIDKNVLFQLGQLQDTVNSVNQGRYEILIKMFLNDLQTTNEHHGDMKANNKWFEVKCEKARVGGQRVHPSTNIDNEAKNQAKILDIKLPATKNIFNGVGHIESLVDELYKTQTDEQIIEFIKNCLKAQFPGGDFETLDEITPIIKDGNVVICPDKCNAVTRLLMAMQIHNYYKEDGFDYFVVIDKNTGDYICLSGDNLNIDKLFDNKKIKVVNGSGGKHSNPNKDEDCPSRENYCQISYA